MAWIESHQSLSRHRKTIRAVALLKMDRHKFLGHMHELWWWGLDNVPMDGWLNSLSDEEIAAGAQWDGDPEQFIKAITSAGFIDVDARGERWLHDWYEYAGKLLKRRADNAERMREARAADVSKTKVERVAHVQNTCSARAPATEPNPTEQNSTSVSNETDAVVAVDKPEGVISSVPAPDSVGEVFAYYQARIKGGARLTDKARRKIKTRCNEFSVSQLKAAMDHFAEDYWYPEHCGHETVAWFFESEDRIEKFANMTPRKRPDSHSNSRSEDFSVPLPPGPEETRQRNMAAWGTPS